MAQEESIDIPPARPEERPLPAAWHPLTPRGVAAFSQAPIGRLLLVQCVVALLAAGAVIWFLTTAWFPTIREAVRHLPASGLIENRQLISPRTSTDPLADSRFLTLVVDVDGVGGPSFATDLRVEFRRRNLMLCSLLGCLRLNYPKDYTLQFNQPELESWWAAWEPMIYSITGLTVVAGLFAGWLVLATFYCPVARIYSFFRDRQSTVVGSWKLSAAALLPGTLVGAGALVLYGQGVIDLSRLLILWALYLPVSWVYLFVSPLRLSGATDAMGVLGRNPFDNEPSGASNPFSSVASEPTSSELPKPHP